MLFDRLIEDTFWFAIAVIAFSVGLMLIVLRTHYRTARHRRQVTFLTAAWKAALEKTSRGETYELPAVDKQTAVEMLRTWCDASESAGRSANAERVIMPQMWFIAARAAGIDALAKKFIERGDAPERIVGARTLGLLADSSAQSRLKVLCSDNDGDVSFAAATALVRISPSFAEIFVACMRDRCDWNALYVEQVICENPLILGAQFVIAVKDADNAGIRRLLEFAPLLQREFARSVAMYALEHPRRDAENVSAALRALRLFVEPTDVERLQRLAEDPVAGVRVQAINALGESNNPHARASLIAHLKDPDGWVRRRAEEALARRGADMENIPCPL
jgi:hypothetical protein